MQRAWLSIKWAPKYTSTYSHATAAMTSIRRCCWSGWRGLESRRWRDSRGFNNKGEMLSRCRCLSACILISPVPAMNASDTSAIACRKPRAYRWWGEEKICVSKNRLKNFSIHSDGLYTNFQSVNNSAVHRLKAMIYHWHPPLNEDFRIHFWHQPCRERDSP